MMDTYAAVYRHVLFPAYEGLVRGRPTMKYLEQLRATQWESYERLIERQDRALLGLLRHAYRHVPFYRERLQEAGALPGDFRSQEDLVKLPPLTREGAQESFEARKSTAPPFPVIAKMTSGTTGQPLSFAYDLDSEYWRKATKLRGYGWAGYRLGDHALHFWGSLDPLYSKKWPKKLKTDADRLLRRETYVDSNLRTDASLAAVVARIESTKPRTIVCFSQAGAALARYVLSQGKRFDIPVICGAEKLFPADREALEDAFGPNVFETYGSREFMLIGAECERHAGLHTSMENLIVEVLVRERDGFRPAEPGETGEIAITDLHNLGCPFIRYLTGDLGVWERPDRCECGRELRRLRSIEGRRNDTLRDARGNAVDALFLNVLFSVLADKVRQFQAVQRRDGSLRLRIVPTPKFDDAVLSSVRKNCQKFLDGIPLQTEIVSHIPLEKNGKLRVVVVE